MQFIGMQAAARTNSMTIGQRYEAGYHLSGLIGLSWLPPKHYEM